MYEKYISEKGLIIRGGSCDHKEFSVPDRVDLCRGAGLFLRLYGTSHMFPILYFFLLLLLL